MQYFSYCSADEQVDALSSRIIHDLSIYLQHQEMVVLAVSGGRSPIPLFHKLSQVNMDWQRVRVTLVDERLVAVDHPDSNERLVKTHLMVNHAACAKFLPLVTPCAGEMSAQESTRHFSYPDVAILGMGEDGHTASLFPGAVELSEALSLSTDSPSIVITPPVASYRRLSLTRAALLKAKQLYLAIQGETKRIVFEKACQHEDPSLPISYFIQQTKAPFDVYWAP